MGGGTRNEFLNGKFSDKVDELAMLEFKDAELSSANKFRNKSAALNYRDNFNILSATSKTQRLK